MAKLILISLLKFFSGGMILNRIQSPCTPREKEAFVKWAVLHINFEMGLYLLCH